MKERLVVAVLVLMAAPAGAQVGHLPEDSPYRDLESTQQISLLTGWFSPAKDPAGVAPRGGPLAGVRYDIHVGGPAQFTARLARVFSERRVVLPDTTAAFRNRGVTSWPVYLADVGLTLNLTGQKSYRRFVPLATLGMGVAGDLKSPDDGGFHLGTTFALSIGGGVRWIPGGPWEFRADLTDHLYQIKYPDSYYDQASDGTQLLDADQASSVWKHNAALTVGASYQLFR